MKDPWGPSSKLGFGPISPEARAEAQDWFDRFDRGENPPPGEGPKGDIGLNPSSKEQAGPPPPGVWSEEDVARAKQQKTFNEILSGLANPRLPDRQEERTPPPDMTELP